MDVLLLFQMPFGQIHLQDARLEEIDIATDSDEETETAKTNKHVIVIWPPYQGPTYLILPTKQEKVSVKSNKISLLFGLTVYSALPNFPRNYNMGLKARKHVFGSEQQRRRLISAFVVCYLESIISKLATSKILFF